jgi:uncharacterized lipoprotein YbaY
MRPAALFLLLAALVGCGTEPTSPPKPGTLIAVTVVSADLRANTAHIVWQVRPIVPTNYLIQRRLADAPWKGLAQVQPDAAGRLAVDDASVQPGASYAYRVRVLEGEKIRFTGEVALDVPAR